MNIYTVIGARPQFIKAAVISNEISKTQETDDKIYETIIHTGQHYDRNMSEKFFEELLIPKPKYNLGIGGGTHGENTGKMIQSIEKILLEKKPDFLLVYGDTDSTLAGSIAASKLQIPILHIEAGLRSFNSNQPEEINRKLTDHLSYICFAPTDIAVKNLLNEGITKERIFLSGDVMADTSRIFASLDCAQSEIFLKYELKPKNYILATIHRAENTNNLDTLKIILEAFNKIDSQIIWPIHPRTRKIIFQNKLDYYLKKINIIDPVGYKEMSILEKNALTIITDSGGIQKEAYFNKVPCVTLRENTEWTELVDSGWNMLVDASSSSSIIEAYRKQKTFRLDSSHPNFYGDGFSASKIINFLQKLKN